MEPLDLSPITSYKVIPFYECVFGVQAKGRIFSGEGKAVNLLDRAGITGPSLEYKTFSSTKDVKSFLIRIPPLEFSRKLMFPVSEIQGRSLGLVDIFSKVFVDQVLYEFSELKEGDDVSSIWKKFFLSLPDVSSPPSFIKAAIDQMQKVNGDISLKELAAILGVSQSKFERGFRAKVGFSPKEFAGFLRFQESLKLAKEAESLTDLAYLSGYYDQAHFIRDFKKRMGQTPSSWFAEQNLLLGQNSHLKK